MPRSIFHALVLLLAAAVLLLGNASVPQAANGDTPAASITTFGDEVDPDSDCDFTEAAGVATITVPGTWHDLTHTEKYDRLNAPRLLNDAEGDFTIQVKIAPFELPDDKASSGGAHTFVSTGLVIWQDDDNFIRMDRAAVPGSQFVWVERFENGKSVSQEGAELKSSAKPKDNSPKNGGAWFRVTRSGDTLTFEQSENGQDWTETHELEATLPGRLKVGVHAINTTNKPLVVKLSEYDLLP